MKKKEIWSFKLTRLDRVKVKVKVDVKVKVKRLKG
jgi:hypothetical protein